jgi:release factor glutamine methyltransferase
MHKNVPENVVQLINISARILDEKKISDARLNAELLLADVLNCSRFDLYLNFDKPLTKDELDRFRENIKRRINHEPLQYITGRTSFYGFDFIVNNKVLIPRPETELLVERILEDIKKRSMSEVSIFEIGSGSGCISVSIAKSLLSGGTDVKIFSIDISEDSTEVAKENLKINNLSSDKVSFIVKDIFEIEKLNRDFDYIISNPPYISYDEHKKLEMDVKDFEPEIALTDFGNGLKFYEKIFQLASGDVFNGRIFCEIGFGQKDELIRILDKNKFKRYRFHNDYSSIPRILEAEK